jgi:hypothetical protein
MPLNVSPATDSARSSVTRRFGPGDPESFSTLRHETVARRLERENGHDFGHDSPVSDSEPTLLGLFKWSILRDLLWCPGITAPICAKAAQIGDPRNRTDTGFQLPGIFKLSRLAGV